MASQSRITGALGFAAALSMAATPAYAAPGTSVASPSASSLTFFEPGDGFSSSAYDAQADSAEWRRGWRFRRGFRRGFRHRRGIRAGEVLAGVAILGGIAAIASAASNNNRRNRNRDVLVVERDRNVNAEIEDLRRRTEEQQREIEYLRSLGRSAQNFSSQSGRLNAAPQSVAPLSLEAAIDGCTAAAGQGQGRGQFGGAISSVNRTATGWNVSGELGSGSPFTCQIGNDGQIEALNGSFSNNVRSSNAPQLAQGGSQWSADRYADARASVRGSQIAYNDAGRDAGPLVPLTSDQMPAYPGGPLPGE